MHTPHYPKRLRVAFKERIFRFAHLGQYFQKKLRLDFQMVRAHN